MKRILIFAMVLAMLTPCVGFAEELGWTDPEQIPTEMDLPLDEALTSDDGSGEADQLATDTLALEPLSATIDYSQSVTLTATASDGGDGVTWTTSDENVAVLSAVSGESVSVTGVNEGTATITCSLGDLEQTCVVTVNAPTTLQLTGVEYPSSLNVTGRGWKLGWGTLASIDDLTELTSSIRDANGEMIREPYTHTFAGGVKRYEIKGIDNSVPFSKVTEEGLYTWVLSATDAAGRTVSVELPIQAVTDGETTVSGNPGAYSPIITAPDGDAAEIKSGESRQLTASLRSGDGAGGEVAWVSNDPAVASVSSSGMVTGVGAGTTTIICKTLDDSCVSAGYMVTVDGGIAADAGEDAEAVPETNPEANVTVNSVQNGERNYAINSAFVKGLEDWNQRGPIQICEITNSDGSNWLHLKGDATPSLQDNSNVQGANQNVFQKYNLYAIPGKPYTLSAKVRGAGADQHCYLNLRWGRSDNSHITNAYYGFTLSENTQIISITVIAPAEADTITIHITTNCESENGTIGNNETNEFYITDIKLELVNTPTAWIPAPEDVASPVNSAS